MMSQRVVCSIAMALCMASVGMSDEANKGDYSIKVQLISREDNRPVPNAVVTLFEVRGLKKLIREIATTTSDVNGRFTFERLAPVSHLHFDFLQYNVVVRAAEYSTSLVTYFENKNNQGDTPFLLMKGDGELKGRIVDQKGMPIAGAVVSRASALTAELGLRTFTTKANGAFILGDLPTFGGSKQGAKSVAVMVRHPNYLETTFTEEAMQPTTLVMKSGCRVQGQAVIDESQQPLVGAVITARPIDFADGAGKQTAITDETGHYQMVLGEGDYHLMLETEANEWVAEYMPLQCRLGQETNCEPFKAVRGGWIAGQLVNTVTGLPQPLTHIYEAQLNRDPNAAPEPVLVGLFGPGRPRQSQVPLIQLDANGRFRIRACPGPNNPFVYNMQASRMSWNTKEMPPVIVRAGEETDCEMTFTPALTDQEKIAAGTKVFDSLPSETSARVDAIIAEFRKLNHTVNECEVWCLLMKELVAIGKPAVPALCVELDATDNQVMLRRLGFALRAIGDPNAVPALIRSLPKTLQPPSSDYGLIVADPQLGGFMRQHQIRATKDGRPEVNFDFGRPVREVQAALERITNHKLEGANLSNITLRKDRRAAAVQQQVYHNTARQWADWWNQNSQHFDVTSDNAQVHLPDFVLPDLSNYPTGLTLSPQSEVEGGASGLVLSPIGDPDQKADFFLDLDLGERPRWPADLPAADASQETIVAATEWASNNGLDLICMMKQKSDTETVYTLSGIDLKLWEIDRFDAKNLSKFVKEGTLPPGRELDSDLVLHLNPATGELLSATNSCFLYLTREQGLGVITITDFITQVQDVTGLMSAPKGVGYHRGVQFSIKGIAR